MAELDGSPLTPADALQLGLTGYGHFTSMRVEDRHVRGFSQHLDRLTRDCRVLYDVELDRDQTRHYIRQALREIGTDAVVARVTIYDPEMNLSHPAAHASPHILVTVRPAMELPATPIRLKAVTYKRDLPQVKHIALFGPLHCRRAAQLSGFDDALFTDNMSFVSEGPTWNIGFYDGSRVVWPNADVLPGITMQLLKQVHYHTVATPVHLRDIPSMEAAFVTNVSVGVRVVRAIDNIELSENHSIISTLTKEYSEIPAERV